MLSLDEIEILVKNKFGEEHKDRYEHTLGVVKMAEYLAIKYQSDPIKAKIAAYLHDFCKYDSIEDVEKILSEQDRNECRMYPVLYHSYGSAAYYRQTIGMDEEIYQAIRNHVFGRLNMSLLEEIILISDYTEENRRYPDCISCREILYQDKFNEAIYVSTKNTIEFLKKKGLKPHPLQEKVLDYYERKCKSAIN